MCPTTAATSDTVMCSMLHGTAAVTDAAAAAAAADAVGGDAAVNSSSGLVWIVPHRTHRSSSDSLPRYRSI